MYINVANEILINKWTLIKLIILIRLLLRMLEECAVCTRKIVCTCNIKYKSKTT